AVTRAPERQRSLTASSPNSTEVPGVPSTPACGRGVPGGLVVTSGGNLSPFADHNRYSPATQKPPERGGGAFRTGFSGRSAARAGASTIALAAATIATLMDRMRTP